MDNTRNKPLAIPGGHVVIFVIIMFVQALATFTVLALATVAPVAALSFHLGAQYVGYQVSLIYVIAAIVSLLSGTLVQRWGAALVSQFAMVLCLLGLCGLAAGHIGLLILGSLVLGAGYGLTNPAASHLLIKITPIPHRNLLFSVKQTAVPLGGVIAGLLLPGLTSFLGWQQAFLVSCLLIIASILFIVPLRAGLDADRKPGNPITRSMMHGIRIVLSDSALLRLSVMAFCYSATQLTLMTFAVTMLVEDLAQQLVIAGSIASLMQGVGAAGRIIWGVAADRLRSGRRILVLIGCLSILSSLLTALVDAHWPLWGVVLLLVVFGMCTIGWNGVFLAEVARLSGRENVSSVTGTVLFFTFSGVVLGPTMFAMLYHVVGSYTHTFGLISIFPVVGTLSLLRLKRVSCKGRY
ncbi:MAG: MFS transporter [Desulfohalobiaceae bacterium]|nr:MFS transporter [Desulfohalobiaceae bacterium]